MSNNLPNLEKILSIDEGFEPQPYTDTLGNWTIGIGYFIGKDLRSLKISYRVALEMLREKVEESVQIALRIFGKERYESWLPARRDAILCLIFNMGEGNDTKGFRSFKKMIRAILSNDWNTAANELRSSAWSTQVDPKRRPDKGRDDRLVFMLRTGEYHEEYKIGSDADH